MLNYIFQDASRNKGNIKIILTLALFRITHCFAKRKRSLLWYFGIPIMIFYRLLVEDLLCVELRAATKVGKGLKIEHGFALVINDQSILGKNVHLRHSTTIGCKMMDDGSQGPSPYIGNNVEIGSNTVILGDIRIGDNAKIGAGSVVIHDVEPNTVVVGNPAKAIKRLK
ncbi:MAG: serine acetyltransferase [Reichenbachiella sp.]|uniref:serine O-acetyltransferase n=1 Tax=Reichenbachiella sp. TaxID=2184521 RepID=UPI003263F93D